MKQKLTAIKPEIDDLAEALGLEKAKARIEELEKETLKAGFWDDAQTSQKILRESSGLKAKVENYNKLLGFYEDALTIIEIALEEQNEDYFEEANQIAQKTFTELEAQKLSTLLSGEYDANNAILTFHAGAGGT
ncbi:MAG: PCRF domain-containing protein, partial [Oscillospiraceae bacterium]|nr:PCRF domain-containing protein [Oscillospiraceae bacterium]